MPSKRVRFGGRKNLECPIECPGSSLIKLPAIIRDATLGLGHFMRFKQSSMKTVFCVAAALAIVLPQAIFADPPQSGAQQKASADQEQALLVGLTRRWLQSLHGPMDAKKHAAFRKFSEGYVLLQRNSIDSLARDDFNPIEKVYARRQIGIKKLQELIRDYPGTPEAELATKVLSDLEKTKP